MNQYLKTYNLIERSQIGVKSNPIEFVEWLVTSGHNQIEVEKLVEIHALQTTLNCEYEMAKMRKKTNEDRAYLAIIYDILERNFFFPFFNDCN